MFPIGCLVAAHVRGADITFVISRLRINSVRHFRTADTACMAILRNSMSLGTGVGNHCHQTLSLVRAVYRHSRQYRSTFGHALDQSAPGIPNLSHLRIGGCPGNGFVGGIPGVTSAVRVYSSST